MPDLIHVSPDLSISVDGDRVLVCVTCGISGLPTWLEFRGEAVASLLTAAQRAFSGRPKGRRARAEQSRAATAARMRVRKVANG